MFGIGSARPRNSPVVGVGPVVCLRECDSSAAFSAAPLNTPRRRAGHCRTHDMTESLAYPDHRHIPGISGPADSIFFRGTKAQLATPANDSR